MSKELLENCQIFFLKSTRILTNICDGMDEINVTKVQENMLFIIEYEMDLSKLQIWNKWYHLGSKY